MTLEATNDLDQDRYSLDAGFGLDPHVLPQFDWLVSQGRITREFADSVIAQRRQAGLPMTPEELQPRPDPLVPSMAWVKEFGGPEIRSQSEQRGNVFFLDRNWSWSSYSQELSGDMTTHLNTADGEHAGWITLDFLKTNTSVRWARTQILDRRPRTEVSRGLLTVSAHGTAASVEDAVAQALDWEFAQLHSNECTWYQAGESTWIVPDWEQTTEMLVRAMPEHFEYRGRTAVWYWESSPVSLRAFLNLMQIHQLSGYASSQEEAMVEASSAYTKVIAGAQQLVGDVDAFAAGKAAGRAELKLEISRLT
jgi:hypothetical protein